MSERWQGVRRVFRLALGRRSSMQEEISEELRFHLEERIEELMARGLSRQEAEREARERFGDLKQVGRQVRRIDHRTARREARGEALRAFTRDLRFGIRALGRHPGFATATVLTLGLFIFVINGLLFWLVGSFISGFSVSGFWPAVFGAIAYSIVSWALSALLPNKK